MEAVQGRELDDTYVMSIKTLRGWGTPLPRYLGRQLGATFVSPG